LPASALIEQELRAALEVESVQAERNQAQSGETLLANNAPVLLTARETITALGPVLSEPTSTAINTAPKAETVPASVAAIRPVPHIRSTIRETMIITELPVKEVGESPPTVLPAASLASRAVVNEPINETAAATLDEISNEPPIEYLAAITETVEPVSDCPADFTEREQVTAEVNVPAVLLAPETPITVKLETLLEPAEAAEILISERLEALEPEQAEAVAELLDELTVTLETLQPDDVLPEDREAAVAKLETIVIELLKQLNLEADEETVRQIIANCLKTEVPVEESEVLLDIEARNRLGTREYKPKIQPHLYLQVQAPSEGQSHRRLGGYMLQAYAA
jgi:hypothetical protein